MAAAEYGRETTADIGSRTALKGRIIAMLESPLALLDKRSLGGRSGSQRLTKSNIAPHERVLSEVRERNPAPGSKSPADSPVVADNINSTTNPSSTYSGIPDQNGSSPSFFSPFNLPFGIGPFAPQAGNANGSPPGNSNNSSTPGDTSDSAPTDSFGIPPGDTDPVSTMPGDTGAPTIGGTPTTGGAPPPSVAVPEPASWPLVVFGLLATALITRRRRTVA